MKRAFRLGLTGSIGMGKSTTAGMFEDLGVPVWDADAAVHRLYGPAGAGTAAVAALCPDAVGPGGVDRARLRAWIARDPEALAALEQAVHPLVASDRQRFLDQVDDRGAPLVLLDIPLLFETGQETECDAVLVVTAPADVQRKRVMDRAGMTPEQFDAILARQTPDAEKRRRADHVIETLNRDRTRAEVARLVARLRQGDGPHA